MIACRGHATSPSTKIRSVNHGELSHSRLAKDSGNHPVVDIK